MRLGIRNVRLVVGALALMLLVAACGGSSEGEDPGVQASSAGSVDDADIDPEAQAALDELVAEAREEPVFTVTINSSGASVAPAMVEAYKERFGLDNVEVQADVAGGEAGLFQKVAAEQSAGAEPSFDAMQGGDDYLIVMSTDERNVVIEDWELLLEAINPLVASGEVESSQVSPSAFEGRGFIWANRSKALIYNTEMIEPEDLPKARADLADPKYKGNLATSPFTSEWMMGPLFYDEDEWLDITDKVGKNAAAVLTPDAQADRLLLGEFALSPSNVYYYYETKDAAENAPIGVHFFSDYTMVTNLMYTVPKGAKAPANGKLWSLWSTTPEFESIIQPANFTPNVAFGQSDLDNEVRKAVEESGTKVVTWFDNEETMAMLDWYATPEGEAYLEKLSRNLTQLEE